MQPTHLSSQSWSQGRCSRYRGHCLVLKDAGMLSTSVLFYTIQFVALVAGVSPVYSFTCAGLIDYSENIHTVYRILPSYACRKIRRYDFRESYGMQTSAMQCREIEQKPGDQTYFKSYFMLYRVKNLKSELQAICVVGPNLKTMPWIN